MKGLIFRELVDMIDAVYGADVLDEVMGAAELPVSNGAYTTVGTYPIEEMVSLVACLSDRVGQAPCDLLQAFGRHILGRFYIRYPAFFSNVRCTYDFVERIDGHIHEEVLKLYPDAELPKFSTHRNEHRLVLEYHSPRALSDLALGLLEASAQHFGESLKVTRQMRDESGHRVVFTLEPTA